MDTERELDVVVFGATGFVGRLVAEYLAEHAPEGTRIALAGRSEERLKQVRAGLGAAAAQWPLLVADSGDAESLAAKGGGGRRRRSGRCSWPTAGTRSRWRRWRGRREWWRPRLGRTSRAGWLWSGPAP